MNVLTVTVGGLHYRTGDLTAREFLTVVRAVHDALTGLGMEPWVSPVDVDGVTERSAAIRREENRVTYK